MTTKFLSQTFFFNPIVIFQMMMAIDRSIDRTINRTINQSINQSIHNPTTYYRNNPYILQHLYSTLFKKYTEPQEDWTVEHVLQWHLLQSHATTDRKLDELIMALQQQFDRGREELFNPSYTTTTVNTENPPPPPNPPSQHPSSSSSLSKPNSISWVPQSLHDPREDTKNMTTVSEPTILHVQVTNGPHTGQTLTLYRPTPSNTTITNTNTSVARNSAPAWVGRSAGKKFRDKGLSLSQDNEVSTTHGKFEWLGGKPYFTDVGSTNGTSVADSNELLETNIPLLLYSDLELVLGRSTLRVTLS
jgi:hypothetical protein